MKIQMEDADYIVLFEKYLKKQATTEEVDLLIQWIRHEESFDPWADEQWDAVSSDIDPALQQRLLGEIQKTISPSTDNRSLQPTNTFPLFRQWAIRLAAVLLLLLATGIGVFYLTQQVTVMPDMIVSVEKGQKATVTLPDGSSVWINSDSRLSYGSRFNAKERFLHLEGEAFFEVIPDKARPFIVQTKDLSVQALGTSFNIKAYENEKQVSAVLMTGKVEVRTKTAEQILAPDEKVIFNRETGELQKKEISDAADYVAWRYNTLRFNAETFENIVLTLERLYNTRIVFESESLKSYRFTGAPNNTSLESVLQILSLTSPLIYEVKNGLILLRENKENSEKYKQVLK